MLNTSCPWFICLLIAFSPLFYLWADFLYSFHNPLLLYLKSSFFFLLLSQDAAFLHICHGDCPVWTSGGPVSQSCEKGNIKRDVFVLFQAFYEPLLCSCPVSIFLRYESNILSVFPEQPCAIEKLIPQSHLQNWLKVTSYFHGVLWPQFSVVTFVVTIFVTFLNA